MIQRRSLFLSLLCLSLVANATTASAAPPLKVGVTLHPYYSWASNVALGLPIEVRAVLPGEVDAGSYQPRPEDIKKLADLDVLLINGIGHDDFIQGMVTASGNKKVVVVNLNEGVPLLGNRRGGAVNSHTFLSFTNAIQQSYTIEKVLARLRPELAPGLRKNAQAYAQRLRAIKAKATARLVDAPETRVVTVHDGYSYLMQELGLEVAAVVEPAHGLVPSAKELQGLVDLLKKEHLSKVFGEESFPKPLLEVLQQATGAQVYVISHVATGAYTPEKFEREMEQNLAVLVDALAKPAAP